MKVENIGKDVCVCPNVQIVKPGRAGNDVMICAKCSRFVWANKANKGVAAKVGSKNVYCVLCFADIVEDGGLDTVDNLLKILGVNND